MSCENKPYVLNRASSLVRFFANFILASALLMASPAFAETHQIKQIVSGDIIILDNGQTVKLLGVDTSDVEKNYRKLGPAKPGSEPKVYRSAEAFIRDTAFGSFIEIELDDANAGSGHKDKDGNLLAYIYVDVPKEAQSAFDHTSPVPEIIKGYKFVDEQFIYDKKTHRIFLNGSIIWSGNGVVASEHPFKYIDAFKGYEIEAKQKGKGQWPKTEL